MFAELALVALIFVGFGRSISLPELDEDQQTVQTQNDVLAFKDTQFLDFAWNKKTKYGLDELNCETNPDEADVCDEFSLRSVRCRNINYKTHLYARWDCDFEGLDPKVVASFYECSCNEIGTLPGQLPDHFEKESCRLNYRLTKTRPNDKSDREGDKNSTNITFITDKSYDEQSNSGLFWIYFAGGCVALLFFLVGMLICFNTAISESCARADCCQSNRTICETLLCIECCCDISRCCFSIFADCCSDGVSGAATTDFI